jgi:signal transduction histidine kinase
LRAFLVFPAVLFVIIASGVSWFQRAAGADDARDTAIADARFAARLAARELDSGIEQAVGDVAATVASPGIEAVFAGAEGCTLNFSSSAPFTSGHLDIVAADGTVLCTSQPGALDKAYAGEAWLVAALRGPLVRSSVRDARTGRTALVVSSPIGTQGVLATFVDLGSIGTGLARSFGGPRHLAFLISDGDKAVATSTAGAFDAAERYLGTAEVNATKWRVTAGADKADALRAAYSVSNKQFIAVAIALPLALLTLFFVHRGLARPIANLRAGVRKATEDLSSEPIDVAGPREISELVDDFNHLVTAARHERELEERLRRAEKADEHERELRLLADRERIGRDLHDTVIQRLFATGMGLESLTNRIEDDDARARVSNAVDEIDETIREVRAAIFDMERGGGASASAVLRGVVSDVGEGLGFRPSIAFSGPVDEAVPAHVADQMAAALRESLTNAAKHSAAGQVEVAVNVGADIALTVRDNGVGIGDAIAKSGGLGLGSMKARAERLGGTFTIDRNPSGGTLVEWRVPRNTTANA